VRGQATHLGEQLPGDAERFERIGGGRRWVTLFQCIR
jgi:hypothetical protein